MSKTSEGGYPEKRLNRRAKMTSMLRVRPSDPEQDHFEDLPISVNVSKNGIFFHTDLTDYQKGMRLFITYPFTFKDDPMKCEYLRLRHVAVSLRQNVPFEADPKCRGSCIAL